MSSDNSNPRNAILNLLSKRGADKTICPSEAARAMDGENWRDLMPMIHAVARALAEEAIVELRQGGERIGREAIVGPYRIAGRRSD